jgi:hypothetical protein
MYTLKTFAIVGKIKDAYVFAYPDLIKASNKGTRVTSEGIIIDAKNIAKTSLLPGNFNLAIAYPARAPKKNRECCRNTSLNNTIKNPSHNWKF